MTEEGIELVKRSVEAAEVPPTDPSDVFRLITIWSKTTDDLFRYYGAITTLGDVWKLVEATLEPTNRWNQPQQQRLWVSAARLIDDGLGPVVWATPSSVGWGEGAQPWRWEQHPRIIWQQPGYDVPSPAHVRENMDPQCRKTMLLLTMPYNLQ